MTKVKENTDIYGDDENIMSISLMMFFSPVIMCSHKKRVGYKMYKKLQAQRNMNTICIQYTVSSRMFETSGYVSIRMVISAKSRKTLSVSNYINP